MTKIVSCKLQPIPPGRTKGSLREYGLEALAASGEQAAARLAHATYYLALVEEAEVHTFDQEQWLDRLEREYDNLRAALSWSVEREEEPSGGSGSRAAMRVKECNF